MSTTTQDDVTAKPAANRIPVKGKKRPVYNSAQAQREPSTPPANPAETAKPVEAVGNPNEFTIIQACKLIGAYYKRDFKDLQFTGPMQFIDGGVCEFVDNGTVVATARMRFKNQMTVDNKTGAMMVPAYLTDLAFRRDSISVSVTNHEQ